jgi:hypothetical protein
VVSLVRYRWLALTLLCLLQIVAAARGLSPLVRRLYVVFGSGTLDMCSRLSSPPACLPPPSLSSYLIRAGGRDFWGVCVRWPAGLVLGVNLVQRSSLCVCVSVFVLTLPLLLPYRVLDHCAYRSLASLDIVIGIGRTGLPESIAERD